MNSNIEIISNSSSYICVKGVEEVLGSLVLELIVNFLLPDEGAHLK